MSGSFDLWGLLFPRKCILCGKLLLPDETDLCEACLVKTPSFSGEGEWIPGITRWTAIWYYDGSVRDALLRYKFRGRRSYGAVFGRLLAQKADACFHEQFDVIVYVPISARRKWKRGYDQVLLMAKSMGKVLEQHSVRALKKVKNNMPQSTLSQRTKRENNVRGAYEVVDPQLVLGKRVLLIDDIITTGSTVKECARVLRAAGAKEVVCAAVAATQGRNR